MTRHNARTIGMTVAALGVLVALVGATIRLIGWALPGSIDGAISAATDEVVRYVRSTAPDAAMLAVIVGAAVAVVGGVMWSAGRATS